MSLFGFLKKKTEEELTAPLQPLPQRNDICWCGSGEKYKKCHLELDQQTLLQIKEKELAQKRVAQGSVEDLTAEPRAGLK